MCACVWVCACRLSGNGQGCGPRGSWVLVCELAHRLGVCAQQCMYNCVLCSGMCATVYMCTWVCEGGCACVSPGVSECGSELRCDV